MVSLVSLRAINQFVADVIRKYSCFAIYCSCTFKIISNLMFALTTLSLACAQGDLGSRPVAVQLLTTRCHGLPVPGEVASGRAAVT